jgi:WD40 repeat protein
MAGSLIQAINWRPEPPHPSTVSSKRVKSSGYARPPVSLKYTKVPKLRNAKVSEPPRDDKPLDVSSSPLVCLSRGSSACVAAGCGDYSIAYIRSPSSILRLDGHSGKIHSLTPSCDGRMILSSGNDSVRLWEPTVTTASVCTLSGTGGYGGFVCMDRAIVVSQGTDLSILRESAGLGKTFGRIAVKSQVINMSTDNASMSGLVYFSTPTSLVSFDLWRASGVSEIGKRGAGRLLSLLYHPGGIVMTSQSDSIVRLYDFRCTGEPPLSLQGGHCSSKCVPSQPTLSEDGRTVLCPSEDGCLVRYDVRMPNDPIRHPVAREALTAIMINDGGILCSCLDGKIYTISN